ncbi:MAG: DUF3298 and DUF4163 domain-containing protein [Acetatifactor sp.]|nr:DUF3298 and DUF4163 domain-containing protein [Acetatifactor sp.]
MKKIAVLLLAVTLFLSGCQFTGQDIPDEGGSGGQGGSSVGKGSSESDPAGDDAPGMSETSLPVINVESINVQRYTEDGETLLVEITKDNMTLSGDGFEKAAETVKKLFYNTEEELSRQADDLVEMAMDQYMGTTDWFTPYGHSTSYEVTRLDANVLSVKVNSYDYEGGAHGYGAEWGTTIDLMNGAELALSQLAVDAPGFMNRVLEVVLEDLSQRQEEEELFDAYESYVEQHIEETSWYLDVTGIVLVYTPYEIGPYSSGNIAVLVPYEEVTEYMKAEYLPTQGNFISKLSMNHEVTTKLSDGEYTVLWKMKHVGPYDDFETTITVNSGDSLVEPMVSVQHAYLMWRQDGRCFLIFDIDWASDDFETFVYELSAGGAVQTADVWAALDETPSSIDSMKLRFSLDVLGTHISRMTYALTEDGRLEPLEDVYTFTSNREWQGLTTVKELPVTVDGQQTTLPAGTSLFIDATDNAGTAWFTTDDESGAISGEIHYERREDDYQLYINGISEYEYFEMIPYTG